MKPICECDMSELLVGPGFKIQRVEESEERITLFAKSTSFYSLCPDCGAASVFHHATFHKSIQAMPLQMKKCTIEVTAYKYECENSSCQRKVFNEPLPFADAFKRRTCQLDAFIMAMSVFMSNEGTANVLGRMGISVSDSSISRMWDKLIVKERARH